MDRKTIDIYHTKLKEKDKPLLMKSYFDRAVNNTREKGVIIVRFLTLVTVILTLAILYTSIGFTFIELETPFFVGGL